jgi:hypothetical protein
MITKDSDNGKVIYFPQPRGIGVLLLVNHLNQIEGQPSAIISFMYTDSRSFSAKMCYY